MPRRKNIRVKDDGSRLQRLKIISLSDCVPFPDPLHPNVFLFSDQRLKFIQGELAIITLFSAEKPIEGQIGTFTRLEHIDFSVSVPKNTDGERKNNEVPSPKTYFSFYFMQRVQIKSIGEIKGMEENTIGYDCEWEVVEDPVIAQETWVDEQFTELRSEFSSVFGRFRDMMTKFSGPPELMASVGQMFQGSAELKKQLTQVTSENLGEITDLIASYLFGFFNFISSVVPTFRYGLPTGYYADMVEVFSECLPDKRLEKFLAILKYVTADLQKIIKFGIYDRENWSVELAEQDWLSDTEDGDADDLAQRYDKIKHAVPSDVRKIIEPAFKKIQIDEQMQGRSEEMLVDRLEWILNMPWGVFTADTENFNGVKKSLNDDHFGLEKVKQRIYEYLAVRKLNPSGKSPILCFVGPPGVGKTSLGKSIARALGRKFVRISLGGLHDEAEIRGHRHTYIGAFPGKIIEGIREAGSMNPVFMLDEIEKVGQDWKGDPGSALIEALDPEQNHSFQDNYLRISFDLSQVFFITTANTIDTLRPALRDRMEIVEIPGYIPQEKLQIAKRHLISKQKEANGFPALHAGRTFDLSFCDDAILKMIYDYTDEAGVRNLDRTLSEVFRKTAQNILSGNLPAKDIVEITEQNIHNYCGRATFSESTLPQGPLSPGVVPVLSVSSSGTGHILFVEVSIGYHPGGRKIVVYGVDASGEQINLGNEIKQSVKIAWDALTSRNCILFDVVRKFEQEVGPMLVSVSLTNLSIAKSGPSAGVPIFLALFGALTEESIRPTSETPLLAATGEITKKMDIISKVGGIREKILAAHRKGIRRVIIPKDNEFDIEDIPKEILEGDERIEIIPESSMLNALRLAYPENTLIKKYVEKKISQKEL